MDFPVINNSYLFECSKCGNCCTGDQRVNLNLFDLYKMALFKGFKHSADLFTHKIVHLVKTQNNCWLPQILFKKVVYKKSAVLKKELKMCPFLINEMDESNKLLGLCCLHPDKKPLICAMSPVGRIQDFKKNDEYYVFVKPVADCPGVLSKTINLLSDLQISLADELQLETRFMKILDSLLTENKSQDYYKETFYSFDCTVPFVKILENLEINYKIAKLENIQ